MKRFAVILFVLLLPALVWGVYHQVGMAELTDLGSGFVVDDGVAYVWQYSRGLVIIDVSDPANPQELGEYTSDARFISLDCDNGVVCVTTYYQGMLVIDASDPAQPFLAGAYPNASHCPDVAVGDGKAYLPANAAVECIDLSDPSNPTLLGSFNGNSYPIMKRIFVEDGIVFGIDESDMIIIDFSTPSQPVLQSTTAIPSDAVCACANSEYACIGTEDDVVHIYDVSNPSEPVLAGSVSETGLTAVALQNDILAVDFDSRGVVTYDISDPTKPTALGSYRRQVIDEMNALSLDDSHMFLLSLSYGLHIIDISDPSMDNLVGRYQTEGLLRGFCLEDDRVYISRYMGGVYILDVTEPANPELINLVDIDSCMAYGNGLAVRDGIAYMPNFHTALATIDLSDPLAPVYLDGLDSSGFGGSVSLDGDLAYLCDHHGMSIVNIANPHDIFEISRYSLSQTASVAIKDTFAYIFSSTEGVHLVDISTPEAPTLLQTLDVPWGDAKIYGDCMYVAARDGGLIIYDCSQPEAPQYVRTILPRPSSYTQFCTLQHGVLFVVDRDWYEIAWYNVDDPFAPVFMDKCAWNSGIQRLIFQDGLIYKIGTYNGLEVLSLDIVPTTDTSVPEPTVTLTCRPNPFNPTTTIAWSQAQAGAVRLCVYNVRGQRVATLVHEQRPEGEHSVVWQGRDDDGKPVGSGVYFARLRTPGRTETTKMLLMK